MFNFNFSSDQISLHFIIQVCWGWLPWSVHSTDTLHRLDCCKHYLSFLVKLKLLSNSIHPAQILIRVQFYQFPSNSTPVLFSCFLRTQDLWCYETHVLYQYQMSQLIVTIMHYCVLFLRCGLQFQLLTMNAINVNIFAKQRTVFTFIFLLLGRD